MGVFAAIVAGIQAVGVLWNQTLSGQHSDQRQSAQRKAGGLSKGMSDTAVNLQDQEWQFFLLLENSIKFTSLTQIGSKDHLINMNDLSLALFKTS